MRKVLLLMLFGLILSWDMATASEGAPASQGTNPADAAFLSSLALSPLDGAIPLLPPNCPVLCNLEQGKSCTGNPLTEPCYDSILRKCSTCNCSANHTWNCLVGA